jgi:hypothetical protein
MQLDLLHPVVSTFKLASIPSFVFGFSQSHASFIDNLNAIKSFDFSLSKFFRQIKFFRILIAGKFFFFPPI